MLTTGVNQIQVNDISGLLVLDWWQDNEQNTIWSHSVKMKLAQFDFRSVIVSNYEIAPSLDDPAQFNTIQQYGWHDCKPEILSPLLQYSGHRKTNQFVTENYGQKSFVLLDTKSILYHLEYSMCSDIENWLVVGGHWGMCTHYRPNGFCNLKNIPYNFFITLWSIYNNDSITTLDDIRNDRLQWVDHNNGFYQLT